MSSFCLTLSIKHNHKTKKGAGYCSIAYIKRKFLFSPAINIPTSYVVCKHITDQATKPLWEYPLHYTLYCAYHPFCFRIQHQLHFFVTDFLQRHHEQKEHADIFWVTLPNYVSYMDNSSSYVLEFIVSFYWWYDGMTLHTLFYKDVSHHEHFFVMWVWVHQRCNAFLCKNSVHFLFTLLCLSVVHQLCSSMFSVFTLQFSLFIYY